MGNRERGDEKAQGARHRAQGTGRRAQGTGHRAQGAGHRAQGCSGMIAEEFLLTRVLLFGRG